MASIVDSGRSHRGPPLYPDEGAADGSLCPYLPCAGQGSAMFSARCGQGLGAEIARRSLQSCSSFPLPTQTISAVLPGDPAYQRRYHHTKTLLPQACGPAFRSPVMMLTAMAASFTSIRSWPWCFWWLPLFWDPAVFDHQPCAPLYSVMQGAIDMVNRIIQENLTAIRVVKSYVRGDYEIQKFEEVNYNLQVHGGKAFRLAALNMPAMQLVMYSTILCILWFGGRLVTMGGVKVGELTGFLSYVMQVLNSLMMFSNVFLMTTRALASWKLVSRGHG